MKNMEDFFTNLQNILLLIASVNNWYEAPLVHFGLTNKSYIKFRNSDIRIPVYKGHREGWQKVIGLTRLRHSQKLVKDGDLYRVCLKESGELSPPLSLDELCSMYYDLAEFLKLINAGASFSNDILKLNFFPKRPSFKIDIWSEMPRCLYQTYYARFYDRFLPGGVEDKTIIDIGAYIGDTAIYFALLGAKQVIAFEPYPRLYRILLENVKLNNLCDHVEAKNVAVWGGFGEMKLRMPLGAYSIYKSAGASILSDGQIIADVPIIPLEEALHDSEVDVVKMNCEGCEFPAIMSADKRTLKKVNTFIIQIHEEYKVRSFKMMTKLREAGFKVIHAFGEFYLATKM